MRLLPLQLVLSKPAGNTDWEYQLWCVDEWLDMNSWTDGHNPFFKDSSPA